MSNSPRARNKRQTPIEPSAAGGGASDGLLQQAFDNSLQANIISTVSSGKIIIANRAACKLLGYSNKDLLTKSRAAIFDVSETSFRKMLKERAAEGHCKALVTAIKKGGKPLTCEVTSATFIDQSGSKKSITTIVDIGPGIAKQLAIDTKNDKLVSDNIVEAQKKSDLRLAQNNTWIKYIAKTSYDVMWDWDIATGRIYVGDSVEELFGYKIRNNSLHFKNFGKCLLPSQKVNVEKKLAKTLASGKKGWKDTYLIMRADGSLASTISRASIVRDDAGIAIRLIGATHDLSPQIELEDKLKIEIGKGTRLLTEYEENFNLLFHSTSVALFDINAKTSVVLLGAAYGPIFGHPKSNDKVTLEDWFSHVHPDDRKSLQHHYQEIRQSPSKEWNSDFRYLRGDKTVADVRIRSIFLRDSEGVAYRCLGCMQETSKETALAPALEQKIAAEENQIVVATEKAKAAERLLLGEELHDNVNQLLCASKLYLDIAKLGGDNIETFLSRSAEYTQLAIEEIRKLTKGLTGTDTTDIQLQSALHKLTMDIAGAHPLEVGITMPTFDEEAVNEKMKLYIFRIVQEQLNNIVKHAKATKASINIVQDPKFIKLAVSDDGIGFNIKESKNGIGISNIKRRVAYYKGTVEFISEPGKGCILHIAFPVAFVVGPPADTSSSERKRALVEKIKHVIVEMIHHSDSRMKTNFSEHLSKKLGHDYTYLANVFSKENGITVEKFIISLKIDKVKEMILQDNLSLTGIAATLHYSSVAHLSHQFKKVTGFTPSDFKRLKLPASI